MEYNNNNCTIYYAKKCGCSPNKEHPHCIQEEFYCLNLT